jgi:hypothetical protein
MVEPDASSHTSSRLKSMEALSEALMADIVAKVGEGRLGRNNRIATSKSLNQPCVSRADLESMLLPRTPKIFLQQYRPRLDIGSDCG